jgi:hypothetical protein
MDSCRTRVPLFEVLKIYGDTVWCELCSAPGVSYYSVATETIPDGGIPR